MPRAILTRALPQRSPLFKIAETAGYELVAQATLAVRFLSFAYPQSPDWLFAYSAHGVRAFSQGIGCRRWLNAHPNLKFAAMGRGTAAAWREMRIEPEFIGAGQPAEVAQAFGALASGERVGFLQAEESRDSIGAALTDVLNAEAVVTYRTEPIQKLKPPPAEVALLTSPKSAEVFLEAYAKTHGEAAVEKLRLHAIGETTAVAASAAGFPIAGLATAPTVRQLVEVLFEIE